MINKLKDNLASIAALIAAVAAIGGGFVKYGEISTRLSQIEAAQGDTIDVSGIVVNAEDIAVLKEKVENVEGKSVDLSGIESNLKKIGKNKDAPKKYKIVVVPTIVIFVGGEEQARFQANIMMQMEANKKEVQNKIYEIIMESF